MQIKLPWDITSHLLEWLLSKSQELKSVGEDVGKSELLYIGDGNVNWCSNNENSMEVPQKIKNTITTWSRSLTLAYISKWNEISILERCLHSRVHWSISHITERKQLSVDEWIKQMWCIYTVKYYSARRNKDILPFAAMRMILRALR